MAYQLKSILKVKLNLKLTLWIKNWQFKLNSCSSIIKFQHKILKFKKRRERCHNVAIASINRWIKL